MERDDADDGERRSERKQQRSPSPERKRDKKGRNDSLERRERKREKRDKRDRKDAEAMSDRGPSGYRFNNARLQESTRGDFDAQIGSSEFMQFPGQYGGGFVGPPAKSEPMSSHVPDQFPGQFPTTSAGPYRPPLAVNEGGPGLAAEYYGDVGQSVSEQPGVRPQQPTLIIGAEPHLQPASSTFHPPQEPSASGGVGAAASFFSGNSEAEANTVSHQPSSSKPGSINTASMVRPDDQYQSSSVPAAGAAAAGAAAGYLANSRINSQEQRPQYTSSITGNYSNTSQRPPSYANANYDATSQYITPTTPGQQSHHTSNTPMYAAGAAGLTAAAFHHNHHNHPSPPYHSKPFTNGSMAQRHRHRGPLSTLVDFFKDPEGVAQFEEYTEYIGVCRDCFAPGSSPRDAPRKHRYRQRRSNERYGSSMRVDKDSRYSSSDSEMRRKKNKSSLEAGIAGYGLAKVGQTLFSQKDDFDDTYSVKSGHPRKTHATSSPDRKSYTSRGTARRSSEASFRRRSGSKERTETGITSDGKVYKKDLHGGIFGTPSVTTYNARRRSMSRSRSRSRSRNRKSGLTHAAVGATIGSAFVASKPRRRDSSPERAFVRARHESHDKGPYRSGGHHSPKRVTELIFFGSQPTDRRKSHKKQKKGGLFSFGNSSSSSSDAGSGPDRRRDKRGYSRRKEAERDDHRKAELAVAGLSAAAAALALENTRQSNKSKRRGDLVAVKETKEKHRTGSERKKRSRKSPPSSEEDAWESASEDDADSINSDLAYGSSIRKRGSRSSLSSDSSVTSKWGWRWGSKKKRMDKGIMSDGLSYTGDATGAATGSMAVNELNELGDRQPRITMHSNSSLPLQQVYPLPTSDPSRFDVARKDPAVPTSQSFVSYRPDPVPIQHPQPITPVSSAVYTAQPSYGSIYEGSAEKPFGRADKPKHTMSDPLSWADNDMSHRNVSGSFPRFGISTDIATRVSPLESDSRRRGSSPGHYVDEPAQKAATPHRRSSLRQSSSTVRFDLPEEKIEGGHGAERRQAQREEGVEEDCGAQRRQAQHVEKIEEDHRAELRRAQQDKERRRRSELREAEEQEQIEREAKAAKRVSRKSSQPIRQPEDSLVRIANQEDTREKTSKPGKSISWAVPAATAAASVVGAAIGNQKTRSHSSEDEYHERTCRERKSRQVTSETLPRHVEATESEERPRERRKQMSVWQEAARPKRSSSHENYAEFFTPTDLLSKPPRYKEGVAEADSDSAITAHEVPEVITVEPSEFRDSREAHAYRFGPNGEEINPDPLPPPWVPRLKLIPPTPQPSSVAGSEAGDVLPSVHPQANTQETSETAREPRTTMQAARGEFETPEYTIIEPRVDRAQDVTSPPAEESMHAGKDNLVKVAMKQPEERLEGHTPNSAIEFGDDLEFAGTLAAGLSEAGFDPSIVVDDPTFRRRESPPGSEEAEIRSPLAEADTGRSMEMPSNEIITPQQGFVEGEVIPHMPGAFDEDEPILERAEPEPKLSKKERKKKKDKQAKRQDTTKPYDNDRNGDDPVQRREDSDKPGIRESEPAVLVQDPGEYVSDDTRSMAASAPIFSETPKDTKKKKSRRNESALDDEASVVSSPTVLVRDPDEYFSDDARSMAASAPISTETPKHKKKKKSRRNESALDDEASVVSPPTILVRDPDEYFSDDARSMAASAPIPSETPKDKKKKKRSKRDESAFDDGYSVVSSPTTRDEAKSVGSKSKCRKGGLFGLFGRSSVDVSEPSHPEAELPATRTAEFEEPKRKGKKKSKDRTADRDLEEIGPIDENADDDPAKTGRTTLPAKVFLPSPTGRDSFPPSHNRLTNPEDEESARSAEAGTREMSSSDVTQHHDSHNDTQPMSFLGMRKEILSPPGMSSPIDLIPYTTSSQKSEPVLAGAAESTIASRRSSYSIGTHQAVDPKPGTSSLPSSPTGRSKTPSQRLSELQKVGSLQHTPSPTAIPFHFRIPPSSPSVSRTSASVPHTASASEAASIPPRPKLRPRSTEFKSSNEFRPLWLVSKHAPKREGPIEEVYPSLPSSHTTSRSSSVHGADEYGYDETWDQSDASENQERSLEDYGVISDNMRTEVDSGLLDSQQPTPTAASFPTAIHESKRPPDEPYGESQDVERNTPAAIDVRFEDLPPLPSSGRSSPASSTAQEIPRASLNLKDLTLGAVCGASVAGAAAAIQHQEEAPVDLYREENRPDQEMVETASPRPVVSAQIASEPIDFLDDETLEDQDRLVAEQQPESVYTSTLDESLPPSEPPTLTKSPRRGDVALLSAEQQRIIQAQDTQDAVDLLFSPISPKRDRRETKRKGKKRTGTAPASTESQSGQIDGALSPDISAAQSKDGAGKLSLAEMASQEAVDSVKEKDVMATEKAEERPKLTKAIPTSEIIDKISSATEATLDEPVFLPSMNLTNPGDLSEIRLQAAPSKSKKRSGKKLGREAITDTFRDVPIEKITTGSDKVEGSEPFTQSEQSPANEAVPPLDGEVSDLAREVTCAEPPGALDSDNGLPKMADDFESPFSSSKKKAKKTKKRSKVSSQADPELIPTAGPIGASYPLTDHYDASLEDVPNSENTSSLTEPSQSLFQQNESTIHSASFSNSRKSKKGSKGVREAEDTDLEKTIGSEGAALEQPLPGDSGITQESLNLDDAPKVYPSPSTTDNAPNTVKSTQEGFPLKFSPGLPASPQDVPLPESSDLDLLATTPPLEVLPAEIQKDFPLKFSSGLHASPKDVPLPESPNLDLLATTPSLEVLPAEIEENFPLKFSPGLHASPQDVPLPESPDLDLLATTPPLEVLPAETALSDQKHLITDAPVTQLLPTNRTHLEEDTKSSPVAADQQGDDMTTALAMPFEKKGRKAKDKGGESTDVEPIPKLEEVETVPSDQPTESRGDNAIAGLPDATSSVASGTEESDLFEQQPSVPGVVRFGPVETESKPILPDEVELPEIESSETDPALRNGSHQTEPGASGAHMLEEPVDETSTREPDSLQVGVPESGGEGERRHTESPHTEMHSKSPEIIAADLATTDDIYDISNIEVIQTESALPEAIGQSPNTYASESAAEPNQLGSSFQKPELVQADEVELPQAQPSMVQDQQASDQLDPEPREAPIDLNSEPAAKSSQMESSLYEPELVRADEIELPQVESPMIANQPVPDQLDLEPMEIPSDLSTEVVEPEYPEASNFDASLGRVSPVEPYLSQPQLLPWRLDRQAQDIELPEPDDSEAIDLNASPSRRSSVQLSSSRPESLPPILDRGAQETVKDLETPDSPGTLVLENLGPGEVDATDTTKDGQSFEPEASSHVDDTPRKSKDVYHTSPGSPSVVPQELKDGSELLVRPATTDTSQAVKDIVGTTAITPIEEGMDPFFTTGDVGIETPKILIKEQAQNNDGSTGFPKKQKKKGKKAGEYQAPKLATDIAVPLSILKPSVALTNTAEDIQTMLAAESAEQASALDATQSEPIIPATTEEIVKKDPNVDLVGWISSKKGKKGKGKRREKEKEKLETSLTTTVISKILNTQEQPTNHLEIANDKVVPDREAVTGNLKSMDDVEPPNAVSEEYLEPIKQLEETLDHSDSIGMVEGVEPGLATSKSSVTDDPPVFEGPIEAETGGLDEEIRIVPIEEVYTEPNRTNASDPDDTLPKDGGVAPLDTDIVNITPAEPLVEQGADRTLPEFGLSTEERSKILAEVDEQPQKVAEISDATKAVVEALGSEHLSQSARLTSKKDKKKASKKTKSSAWEDEAFTPEKDLQAAIDTSEPMPDLQAQMFKPGKKEKKRSKKNTQVLAWEGDDTSPAEQPPSPTPKDLVSEIAPKEWKQTGEDATMDDLSIWKEATEDLNLSSRGEVDMDDVTQAVEATILSKAETDNFPPMNKKDKKKKRRTTASQIESWDDEMSTSIPVTNAGLEIGQTTSELLAGPVGVSESLTTEGLEDISSGRKKNKKYKKREKPQLSPWEEDVAPQAEAAEQIETVPESLIPESAETITDIAKDLEHDFSSGKKKSKKDKKREKSQYLTWDEDSALQAEVADPVGTVSVPPSPESAKAVTDIARYAEDDCSSGKKTSKKDKKRETTKVSPWEETASQAVAASPIGALFEPLVPEPAEILTNLAKDVADDFDTPRKSKKGKEGKKTSSLFSMNNVEATVPEKVTTQDTSETPEIPIHDEQGSLPTIEEATETPQFEKVEDDPKSDMLSNQAEVVDEAVIGDNQSPLGQSYSFGELEGAQIISKKKNKKEKKKAKKSIPSPWDDTEMPEAPVEEARFPGPLAVQASTPEHSAIRDAAVDAEPQYRIYGADVEALVDAVKNTPTGEIPQEAMGSEILGSSLTAIDRIVSPAEVEPEPGYSSITNFNDEEVKASAMQPKALDVDEEIAQSAPRVVEEPRIECTSEAPVDPYPERPSSGPRFDQLGSFVLEPESSDETKQPKVLTMDEEISQAAPRVVEVVEKPQIESFSQAATDQHIERPSSGPQFDQQDNVVREYEFPDETNQPKVPNVEGEIPQATPQVVEKLLPEHSPKVPIEPYFEELSSELQSGLQDSVSRDHVIPEGPEVDAPNDQQGTTTEYDQGLIPSSTEAKQHAARTLPFEQSANDIVINAPVGISPEHPHKRTFFEDEGPEMAVEEEAALEPPPKTKRTDADPPSQKIVEMEEEHFAVTRKSKKKKSKKGVIENLYVEDPQQAAEVNQPLAGSTKRDDADTSTFGELKKAGDRSKRQNGSEQARGGLENISHKADSQNQSIDPIDEAARGTDEWGPPIKGGKKGKPQKTAINKNRFDPDVGKAEPVHASTQGFGLQSQVQSCADLASQSDIAVDNDERTESHAEEFALATDQDPFTLPNERNDTSGQARPPTSFYEPSSLSSTTTLPLDEAPPTQNEDYSPFESLPKNKKSKKKKQKQPIIWEDDTATALASDQQHEHTAHVPLPTLEPRSATTDHSDQQVRPEEPRELESAAPEAMYAGAPEMSARYNGDQTDYFSRPVRDAESAVDTNPHVSPFDLREPFEDFASASYETPVDTAISHENIDSTATQTKVNPQAIQRIPMEPSLVASENTKMDHEFPERDVHGSKIMESGNESQAHGRAIEGGDDQILASRDAVQVDDQAMKQTPDSHSWDASVGKRFQDQPVEEAMNARTLQSGADSHLEVDPSIGDEGFAPLTVAKKSKKKSKMRAPAVDIVDPRDLEASADTKTTDPRLGESLPRSRSSSPRSSSKVIDDPVQHGRDLAIQGNQASGAGILGDGAVMSDTLSRRDSKRSGKSKKNKKGKGWEGDVADISETTASGVQVEADEFGQSSEPSKQSDLKPPKSPEVFPTQDMESYDTHHDRPVYRDSAIHVSDSPIVSDILPTHYIVRDSGYQDTEASPIVDLQRWASMGRTDALDPPFEEHVVHEVEDQGQHHQRVQNPEEPGANPFNMSVEADPSYSFRVLSPASEQHRTQNVPRSPDDHRGFTEEGFDMPNDRPSSRSVRDRPREPALFEPSVTDEQHNVGFNTLRDVTPFQVQNDRREPSPVSPSTKDRSSILFQSSPSTREELANIQQESSSPPPSEGTHQHASGPAGCDERATSDPAWHPSPFGGPLSTENERPLSPKSPLANEGSARRPLDTIKEYSPEDSPLQRKARTRPHSPSPERGSRRRRTTNKQQSSQPPHVPEAVAKDMISTDDIISRLSWPAVDEEQHFVDLERSRNRTTDNRAPSRQSVKSPLGGAPKQHDGEYRSFSNASIRSGESINAIIRTPDQVRSASGLSYHSSGTPPLRRVDRSVSGDLRAKSLAKQSEAELQTSAAANAVASSSSYDPTKDKGKTKMADVYVSRF